MEQERRDWEYAEERERRERERAEERERMEKEREEERRRYAEESERRMQEMHRQMEHLQRLVAEKTTVRPRDDIEPVKLTRLTEGDDIEAYLTTFERIMMAHEVSKERWSFKLAPQLTGRAQQAYAALPPDDAKSYEAVKVAILRRYEETYRQRFRTLKPKEGESPQELMTRLRDLATRWTKESSSREALLDLIVKEQFLTVLPDDVRIAVIERQPKDGEEASQFAENYLQARSASIARKEAKRSVPTTKCPRCGEHGHWARDCTRSRNTKGPRKDTTRESGQDQSQTSSSHQGSRQRHSDKYVVRCSNCSEKGHVAFKCPKRSLYCGQSESRVSRENIA